MNRTVEERVGAEIDTLWQAALFLGGGSRSRAERLLCDSVVAATDEYGGMLHVEDRPDGLERFLVRRFFRDAPPLYLAPASRSTHEPVDGVAPDVEALLREAGRIPRRPRAAVWLIMIRRHSYAEGASILDIDEGELPPLLTHRDALVAHLIGRSGRKLADLLRRRASPEESAL